MNKNTWVAVVASIFVVGFFLFGGTIVNLFSNTGDQSAATQRIMMNGDATEGAGSLVIQDVMVGTGAEAVAGSKVSVHYTGALTNGQKFDSSLDRGVPFEFVLGSGSVIPGWEQGIAGMKVGGKRVLVIPPQLAYGAQAIGNVIPANSTLVFEVELVGVGE